MVPLLEVSYLPAVLKDSVFTLGLFCCPPPSQSSEATHPRTKDLEGHFETNILDYKMWDMGATPLPEPASQ